METKQLIKELELISRRFMRDKEFYKAGRINLAIDTINEVLPQADVIKSVCPRCGQKSFIVEEKVQYCEKCNYMQGQTVL